MSLQVRQLNKEFPTRNGPLPILRDLSLEMNRGEALAVMGPSGSGKSTLLHILGTLDTPTSGTVLLDGKDPFTLAERDLADFRNQNVGFVFQDHHLLPQCSVLENVLIPTLVNRGRAGSRPLPGGRAGSRERPEAGSRERPEGRAGSRPLPDQAERWARDLLGRVGLSGRLDHRPAELSGGERQRVAVARALVQHPLLLLADEPTGNLDRLSAQAVGQLLLDLHRQEQTILVVVTHSAELAATFPRRVEMVDGTLQALKEAAR